MMTGNVQPGSETVLPFQLDNSNVRGRISRLDGVLSEVLSQHSYPETVEKLVAEMTLLTALIGQTIKLRWKLSLQLRSDGPIRLIATDYYAPTAEGVPARLRAYASYDAERLDTDADAFEQLGKGYFAVLIDQGQGTEPYQGITPLSGGSLSQCAESYFEQSEQLPTRFKTAFGKFHEPKHAERWIGGGIMIQQMPEASPLMETAPDSPQKASSTDANEEWARANILLDTAETHELIGPDLKSEALLYRLFHEDAPRVFDAQTVEFGCTCSEDRVRQSLSIYSQKDIAHMKTDDGIVTADCQFCGAHYAFAPATLGFEAKDQA